VFLLARDDPHQLRNDLDVRFILRLWLLHTAHNFARRTPILIITVRNIYAAANRHFADQNLTNNLWHKYIFKKIYISSTPLALSAVPSRAPHQIRLGNCCQRRRRVSSKQVSLLEMRKLGSGLSTSIYKC
jgi:hypothetical protein